VDANEPAAKEINTQLKVFDDRWNDIAKQAINRIQQVRVQHKTHKRFCYVLVAVEELNFCLQYMKSVTKLAELSACCIISLLPRFQR